MRSILLRIWLPVILALPWLAPGDSPSAPTRDMTVHVWSQAQGLPDDFVTAVLQTHDGYLWIGTDAGLARFDGVRFVTYHESEGRMTNEALKVLALCEDTGGRLWVGTQGKGLLYFQDGKIFQFQTGADLIGDTVNSIAEDSAGNLWAGTASGLVRIGTDRTDRFTTKEGLPADFVSNIHVARSGVVWITTRGGMCQFKNGRLTPFPFQTDSPGRSPESLGVYEDRSGNLWAFGDTYLVNLTEGKHLNHFGSGDSLSALRIWSLCEGQHGELWIGTSGKGLYCFAGDKFTPVSLNNGGLTSDVRALCEDREGNLWLGTYGGGLMRLQAHNERMWDAADGLPNEPVTCINISPPGRVALGYDHGGVYLGSVEQFERLAGHGYENLQDSISSICTDGDSSLWIGTPGDGIFCLAGRRVIHYGTPDGLSDDRVFAVAADAAGNLWSGTFSGRLDCLHAGGVIHYGIQDGLPTCPLTAILTASNGVLWIGDAFGGVLRGEGGHFKTIIEPAVLGAQAVRALHEDNAGRLWIGTAASRLACISTGTYLTWNLNLRNAADPILGILSEDDGGLWLGTPGAIYHIAATDIADALASQKPPRCQLVYESDATPGTIPDYGWPLAAKMPDGKLWFAMTTGCVMLDPHRLPVDISTLPAMIEEIAVNGNEVVKPSPPDPARTPTKLPSDLRSLDIQFTALDFSEPEKVRFRHRLDGSDPDWVETGDQRSVHYGHLPYGPYKFRVQAGTTASGWDPREADFQFLVPTPLWRTGWALAFYILVTMGVVASVVRVVSNRRLRLRLQVLAQQQAMERERMRIAQDMHDEIGSKLTKISFMSERAKGELQGQESVAKKLNSIAGTSRDLLQSLDEIVWAVNPHNDTLEHLAAYLGHYATEYLQNTSVECELHIPQGLPHHPLSAEFRHNLFLAFEEALNNALKHGQPTLISVNMRLLPSHFEIVVEDNGTGFDPEAVMSASTVPVSAEKRVGYGLRNLQQRLADLGGNCEISSRAGSGCKVILTVPLKAPKNSL